MISVVLACCERDQDQALRVLNWSAELGFNFAKLFILCSKGCNVNGLMEAGKRGFSEVSHIEDNDDIQSNWHEVGNHLKSAAGPNSLFRTAAWYFYGKTMVDPKADRNGWLFWEPDAVPGHAGWLRDINDEYQIALQHGKWFLGFEVNRKTHPGDVGTHMSGVAVYPFDVPMKAPAAVSCGDTAFDIEAAEQIMPQMYPSRTIFHHYRPPSFETQEDFEKRVPRQLALYHACKDGSIYRFLRTRLGLKGGDEPCVIQSNANISQTVCETPAPPLSNRASNGAGSSLAPHAPIVDIFIKTRPHDYPWLEWCIKSITRFSSGFRDTLVLSPDVLEHGDELQLHLTDDSEPGYLSQQAYKLRADEWTDAEWILYMDSDCVFTHSVTPQDFIKDGKPIWLYTPLDQARPDQHVWAPIMEKFLGKKPEHEFMRRHPFIVPRWALSELRTFCKYKHGQSILDYIISQADPGNPLALRFSEWNCLGFFLWEYHRDRVHWVLDSEAGPSCVFQGFTHGGEQRKKEDLAKFKELLDGHPEEKENAGPVEDQRPASFTVSDAIALLAVEAQKDGFAKARIMRQLKSAFRQVKSPVTGRPRGRKKPLQSIAMKIMDRVFEGIGFNSKTLLCIHSYPGANETVIRHWPQFVGFGANRIVGIGTTDGKCKFPCESVNIGEDGYMKLKGQDDHLCRRLLDTVKWCLTQPEYHFAILEYDTLVLRPMPAWTGINAYLTGGQVNGSKASQFYHNPWLFDRGSGEALVKALEAVLPECQTYPDNSPDLFFGLACERAGIKVGCNFKLFTRNSIELGDAEEMKKAILGGAHVLHGVKKEWTYNVAMEVLNETDLAVSK